MAVHVCTHVSARVHVCVCACVHGCALRQAAMCRVLLGCCSFPRAVPGAPHAAPVPAVRVAHAHVGSPCAAADNAGLGAAWSVMGIATALLLPRAGKARRCAGAAGSL